MHRQPDRRLLWRRPLDSMPLVCRNVDEVPRLHLDCPILKPKPCRSLQHDDPFVLVLVVPEAFGRGLAVGDDSLDADLGGGQKRLDKLLGQVRREVGEEVGGDSHISSIPSFLNHRASPISKAAIASASVRSLSSPNTSLP